MNIKNVICALGLVSLGLVGCAASHPPQATNARPPTAEEVALAPAPMPADTTPPVDATPAVDPNAPITVSGSTWSFVLPDGSWAHQGSDDESVAKNGEDTIRIIFLSQPWEKTPGLFPMTVIHAFQTQGSSVKVYKTVVINGVKYVHVILNRSQSVDVGMWLAVHNKKAYGFMCGGAVDENLTKTCEGIASTLKLN